MSGRYTSRAKLAAFAYGLGMAAKACLSANLDARRKIERTKALGIKGLRCYKATSCDMAAREGWGFRNQMQQNE
jgi:hypothetical protein